MFYQGDLGRCQATVSKEMHPAKAVRCLARPDLMVLQLQVQAGVHTTSNDSRRKTYTTAKNLVALLRNYVSEPDQQTNAAATAAAAAASPSARLSASLSVLFEFGTSIRSPNASRSMELMQLSPNFSNTLLLLMKNSGMVADELKAVD